LNDILRSKSKQFTDIKCFEFYVKIIICVDLFVHMLCKVTAHCLDGDGEDGHHGGRNM